MGKRWWRWLVALPVALVVMVSLATWTYIHVFSGDAPARLSLDSVASGATAAASTTTTAGGASSASKTGVDGTWKVSSGSQAGYRVKEVLFGQSTEAVGRTNGVTGQIVISGTSVSAATFTVDMRAVTSDESRRDNQFNGRIMSTSTYPTSTFVLTKAIDLGTVPADGTQVGVTATGKLTLRGVTKTVTIDLTAQRSGTTIKIVGSVPIVFAEWSIPNPSAGPATTGDSGELEFLLVLAR